MEYILNNIILALLEYPNSTLLGVNRMLSDKDFRNAVVANITDPSIKAFWVDEFAKYTDKFMTEAGAAIQNKIGQFTSNPLIRNIVGQPKGSLDIRKIMDEKKILIMNLSKGRMGEINANLIGGMLITKIYLAAMSRASATPAEMAMLPDFYFYVDEFQSFVNDSFKDILSEARKYKLCLTIAHQYIEQMPEEVRNAVFGNVGTTISFRVGPFDAEVLEKVFAPQFEATDLVNLGFAQVYLTLMIDGVGSPPFSARTIATISVPPVSFVPQIMDWSHGMYAKPLAAVEEEIRKWHEPIFAPRKELPPRAQGVTPQGMDRPRREPSFFKMGEQPPRNAGPRSGAPRPFDRPRDSVRPPLERPPAPPRPIQPHERTQPIPPPKPVSLDTLKKTPVLEEGKATLREALAVALKEQEEKKAQKEKEARAGVAQSASADFRIPAKEEPIPPPQAEKKQELPQTQSSATTEELKRLFETGETPGGL